MEKTSYKKYPETISLRYLAPPITVSGLVTGLIFILLNIFTNISFFNIGWLAIFSYLAVLILGFITIKGKISLKSRLLLFLVLPTMHLSWGVGFLKPTKRL